MKEAKYPVSLFDNSGLNANGINLLEMMMQDFYGRIQLDATDPCTEWKTFRDVKADKFRSLFTGQRALPLPDKWINLK